MAQIIGGIYTAPDTFAFMQNPDLQWYDLETFLNASSDLSTKDYWATRDKYWASAVTSPTTGRGLNYKISDTPSFYVDDPSANLYANRRAWQTLDDALTKKRGRKILAFDTETIGDFMHGTRDTLESRIAGITEISFSEQKVLADQLKEIGPTGSFVFGIDSEQARWLRETLDKKKSGMALSDVELSGLERASRYSTIEHDGHVFSTRVGDWRGQQYTFANSLNVSNAESFKDIESGIAALEKIYSPDRDARISNIVSYIDEAERSGTAIIGQNLQYDTDVIRHYASMRKTATLNPDFQYADSMFAMRAYANANNTTVAEMVRGYNGSVANSRLGSLEAFIEAIRGDEYTKFGAHNAYEDSLATLEVFTNRFFNINGRAQSVLSGLNNSPNEISLADSLIKINKKGNIRSSDFLVIDGQVTTGYAPSNMYWNLVGTGTTTFDALEVEHPTTKKMMQLRGTQDKFVAQFESASGDGASLFKTFDTVDDFQSWLKYNTSIRSKASIDAKGIALQQTIHDKDIARRVIDGFFDPNSVSQYTHAVNGLTDAGGFAGFQNYFSMYKELSELSDQVVTGFGIQDINGKNITTARQLIANIGVGNNIVPVIEYADKHDGLSTITSMFRNSQGSLEMTPSQAAIRSYSARTTMQEVFSMFDNNAEFFAAANDILSKVELAGDGGNLQRTIAFQGMKEAYLKHGDISIARDIAYTVDDMNIVSVATSNGRFSNIDVSDIRRGSGQLQKLFLGKGVTESTASTGLFGVLDYLENQQLIGTDRAMSIRKTFDMRNNSYGLANSIVSALHDETSDIRSMGIDQYSAIKTRLDAGESIESLSSSFGEKLVTKIANKNHRSLIESASSEMSLVSGGLTEDARRIMNAEALSMNKATIIKGTLDGGNAQMEMIKSALAEMNYDARDIDDFMRIFYNGGTGKSNISRFNKALQGTGDAIKPVFYKSGAAKTADYLMFTREKDYAKLMTVLTNLDDNATGSHIKREIEGLASYFEIPYLERINLEDPNAMTEADKIIRKLNGDKHGAQTVLVKQGDSGFYRYDTMSLNMYGQNKTVTIDGREVQGTVLSGRIQDSGGSYLTSIRQRAERGYFATSEGNYSSANRLFNDPNKSRMTDAAAPQFGGVPDGRGGIKKLHMFSQKDIDYAHAISLQSEKNMSLIELLEELQTGHIEEGIQTKVNGYRSNQGIDAIHQLFNAFNEEYGLAASKDERKAIAQVFESEQFRIFSSEFMTSQSGGIGQNRFIQDYINSHSNATALKAMQDKSLLEIMAVAVQDNAFIEKDLATTINILAHDMNLDSIGSESFAHKNMMFFGGYHIANNNNSRLSGQYRPTYAQRSNYRPFTLESGFFSDTARLSEDLGIHFGDVYTSKSYIDYMTRLDTHRLAETGDVLTRENASYRNIIGAVQSISDAEIQANRVAGGEYLTRLAALGPEYDQGALSTIYERMVGDLNTYEGKFYVRPSLANENFFVMGDPKSYKNADIRRIFESGTEAEQKATAAQLKQLEGTTVKNGSIIGWKTNAKGELTGIRYSGPTIDNFSREYSLSLMEYGRADIEVRRQLEDFKLFIGEEKGTAETLAYFSSVNPEQQLAEIKETMRQLGLKDYTTDVLEENIATLNKYTDAVYDILTYTNATSHKTVVIFNNNVNKHLTDMAIDTKWNLIMHEFNSEQGLTALQGIGKNINFADGTSLASHLGYDALHQTLTFDNPIAKGSVNVLDQLITALRKDDGAMAKSAIKQLDAFASFNGGFQSIQRQYMNTFMGEAFKMDQRVYQTLVMQAQGDKNYVHENGAKLAETIRSRIKSGWYDENVSKVMQRRDIIDSTWRDIVRDRRGILKPRGEEEMLVGILESFKYLDKPDLFDGKNIMTLDAKEIIANIPKGGSNYEGYKNFIFKIDGQLPSYLESRAIAGSNQAFTEAQMNAIRIDLSQFGSFKYHSGNGDIMLDSIMIPIQHISSTEDQIFVGESTKNTIHFFNELERFNRGEIGKDKVEKALEELFDAYASELNSSDKNSLVSKVNYKMKMPNSSGALALDALSPTVYMDSASINEISNLENTIAIAGSNGKFDRASVERLVSLYGERQSAVNKQIAAIDKAIGNSDIVSLLNMTGTDRYKDYLRSYDKFGNLITDSIDSAIVVSKEMFERTEMDTGRIGHQLFTDYFSGSVQGLKKFEKITHNGQNGSRIFNIDFNQSMQDFFQTFDQTAHADWAQKTRYAIEDIMSGVEVTVGKKTYGNGVSSAVEYLNDSISRYMRTGLDIRSGLTLDAESLTQLESELLKDYQREFLAQVNQGFENIGDRYAREVGILGITNRYPNFSQAGTLPVRIYLDDTVHGNQVRFLGPQFSILQNLDFDGDTEFLSFLGNGGLLDISDKQYAEMLTQFQFMNKKNVDIFKHSLQELESFKSYRIGDETAFKATLLKELANEQYYKPAEEAFLSALTENDREYMSTLKQANEGLYSYIVDHSIQINQQFKEFDKSLGSSITNQQMVKAAMQARVAKEYIGNFSKPNLDIRDAMTYMLSKVEDQNEEEKLLQIKELLFTIDPKAYESNSPTPGGLLTLLEQKGIDTKHVHDAENLNNSTAWRQGVRQLFSNVDPNLAKKVDDIDIIENLVAGSRKVFEFVDDDKTVAQRILNRSWEETISSIEQGTVDKTIVGELYIRGLYEMSHMQNAYEGYFGTFKKASRKTVFDFIQSLNDEDVDALVKSMGGLNATLEGMSLDDIIKSQMFMDYAMHRTDEKLNTFGRALSQGDILAYQSAKGPEGYIFQGLSKDGHNIRASFQEYDFATGKVKDGIHTIDGVTIRDLNEQIKRNPREGSVGRLLDYSRPDIAEKNINVRYIDDITDEVAKVTVRRRAAELSVADKLQTLFDNIGNADFENIFNETIQKGKTIPAYSPLNIGGIMANIVGDDSAEFARKVNQLEDYLQFGLDNGYIASIKGMQGSTDAKDLMRHINNEIAKNPPKMKSEISSRLQGETVQELVENYTQDFADVHIRGDQWLRTDLNLVQKSNEISQAIETARINQAQKINEIGHDFYSKYLENVSDDELQNVFETTSRSAFDAEVDSTNHTIFSAIESIRDVGGIAEEEMMRQFDWDQLAVTYKTPFLIPSENGMIIGEAKVGYGRFIGEDIAGLSQHQAELVLQELEEAATRDGLSDIERLAIQNTDTLVRMQRFATTEINPYLDFSSADSLRDTAKVIFAETEEASEAAKKAAQESVRRSAEENVEKKTLRSSIAKSIHDMTPENKRLLKIGGAAIGGAALLGLAGHALFNAPSSSVEVPNTVEDQIDQSGGSTPRKGKNLSTKNAGYYPNQQSDAQGTQRMQQKKIAPPSLPKNRTIYHDAKSGFNFKVSAQSYNKLQAESYARMANQVGGSNVTLNTTRDNSRITDNWLQNKFAELTE